MYKVLSTKMESGMGDFVPGMGYNIRYMVCGMCTWYVVFGIWDSLYLTFWLPLLLKSLRP